MSAPELQCPGNRLSCPVCGKPIPRISAREGNGFAQCDRYTGSGEERRRCGAHLYYYCSDRLCTVLSVPKSFHDRFEYHEPYATHEEILEAYADDVMEAA